MENFDSDMISEIRSEDLVFDDLQKNISDLNPDEELKEDAFIIKRQLSKNMFYKYPLSKHIPKDILNSSVYGASKNILQTSQS